MIANKRNFKKQSFALAYANLLDEMWCQKYEYIDIKSFKVNYK